VDRLVNGTPLFLERVTALAVREGIDEDSARRRLVEAMLVAEEARRSGFPGTKGDSPDAVAARFLGQVFSEATLCANITQRQLQQFYELSYRPEWTVDVYKGELVEVRCCPSMLDRCDAVQVKRCRERNRTVPAVLEEVAEQWRAGRAPTEGELTARHPGLDVTDFGFVVFPGIPLERQKPKSLFDLATIRKIVELKPGEVSAPIESELGYHVVKLTHFRSAITADSPEFLSAGRQAVCRSRVGQTRRDYVSRLVGNAVIEPPLR
jgi:hypothetical protein